jgi:hypothetical protein
VVLFDNEQVVGAGLQYFSTEHFWVFSVQLVETK